MAVSLTVDDGLAILSGDVQRRCPLADLHVSERLSNASRKVTFPDGAYLEILDTAAFNALLATTGHDDSLVVQLQQSGRAIIAAVVLTTTLLTLGYLYALPALSEVVAKALPEKVERAIGTETLNFLDARMLAPSELPSERQQAIVNRFRSLTSPQDTTPGYTIVFRKSKIGPNAFALPSGHIVLTDEIVKLVDSDDAVMGILSHELGHLHERHLTRRILQSSAIGAVATVMYGDVSSVVANIPTLMLDLKYSRDAETEADDFAITMLKQNGISRSALIRTFEKLDKDSSNRAPYLSSHPPTSDRIERIRSAR